MSSRHLLLAAATAVAFALPPAPAFASATGSTADPLALPQVAAPGSEPSAARRACEREFTPEYAQTGKDVIWIPTRDALVARMLRMADVQPTDVVVDLGAGDGRIAIAAARDFGARARGIEYDPRLVDLAACLARADGVDGRATFVRGDIFASDFRDATVVTMYLLPELNLRLRPTLLGLRPGTRIVSHAYDLGDWKPDEDASLPAGQAFLWIVPAQVAGRWRFATPQGTPAFDVEIEQRYQVVGGSVRSADGAWSSKLGGRLRGDALQLEIDRARAGVPRVLRGVVRGDRIEAEAEAGGRTLRYVGTRATR